VRLADTYTRASALLTAGPADLQDLEMMLSNVITSAFEGISTVEAGCELLRSFYALAKRPVMVKYVNKKTSQVRRASVVARRRALTRYPRSSACSWTKCVPSAPSLSATAAIRRCPRATRATQARPCGRWGWLSALRRRWPFWTAPHSSRPLRKPRTHAAPSPSFTWRCTLTCASSMRSVRPELARAEGSAGSSVAVRAQDWSESLNGEDKATLTARLNQPLMVRIGEPDSKAPADAQR
jgi:hypothetical protein